MSLNSYINRLKFYLFAFILTLVVFTIYTNNLMDINTINILYDHIEDATISIKYRAKDIPSSDIQYKIPKVVYQTWFTKNMSELSNETKKLIERNKALNPDVEFQLWDDHDIDEFIKKEFPSSIYESFISINPILGAAKADFFRYCVIYQYGGIYLDLKSTIKIPYVFGNIIKPNDEAILDVRRTNKMPYRQEWNYGSYEQWFLAFSPKHPYLHAMIKLMTHNIQERITILNANTLKEKVLRLTGPDAYAVAIHKSVIQYGIRHREISYFEWLRYRSGRFSEYKYSKRIHYPDVSSNTSLYVNAVNIQGHDNFS